MSSKARDSRSTSRCGTGWPTRGACASTFISDGLWLAPLDPQALLGARTYSEFDGHIVLEVHAPDGSVQTLAVDGNATGARCEPTDAAPDLVLDTATLGACLLGGNRFHDYAAAKAVEEVRPARSRTPTRCSRSLRRRE